MVWPPARYHPSHPCCPKCGRIADHCAGVNVPGGSTEFTYRVCWKCGIAAQSHRSVLEWRWIRGNRGHVVTTDRETGRELTR